MSVKPKLKKESDEKIIDKLFPFIIKPMRFLELWPQKAFPWKRTFFVLLTLFYVHVPMYIYALKHRDDFVEASYAICETVGGTIYYVRLLWFFILPEVFLEAIENLKIGWKNASICALPDLTQLCKKIEGNSRRFSIFIIIFYLIAGANYSVFNVLIGIFRVYALGKNELLNFGYHVDFIVNVIDPLQPFKYAAIVIPESFIFMTFVFALSLIALFYVLLIYYTGILFRIVSLKLEDLNRKLDKMNENEIIEELNKIIELHEHAFQTASKVEEATRQSMLTQYIVNRLFVCLLGFDVIMLLPMKNYTSLSNLLGYGSGILFELFMDSYVCERLSQESAKVSDAVWNMDWFKQSVKVRHHLLLIMTRAQKPLGISMGKFYLISLNSFLQVLRNGISYFTIMRQLYSK